MKMQITFITLCIISLYSCKPKEPKLALNLDGLKAISQNNPKGFFTVINAGNDDLEISDYRATCKCISLELLKGSKIKANDSVNFPIEVKPNTEKRTSVHITIKANTKPALASFEFVF